MHRKGNTERELFCIYERNSVAPPGYTLHLMLCNMPINCQNGLIGLTSHARTDIAC